MECNDKLLDPHTLTLRGCDLVRIHSMIHRSSPVLMDHTVCDSHTRQDRTVCVRQGFAGLHTLRKSEKFERWTTQGEVTRALRYTPGLDAVERQVAFRMNSNM